MRYVLLISLLFSGSCFAASDQKDVICVYSTVGHAVELGIRGKKKPGVVVVLVGVPKKASISQGFESDGLWYVEPGAPVHITVSEPGQFDIVARVVEATAQSERTFRVVVAAAAAAAAGGEAELERGRRLMKSGDVAAARLVFEELALDGSAPAAKAMAETYDENVLRQLRVKGLVPDPQKAAFWYQKAQTLGGGPASNVAGGGATAR